MVSVDLNDDKYYVSYKQFEKLPSSYGRRAKLTYNGKVFDIGAGNSDSVRLFRVDEDLIVLSVNLRMGYVGIEVFDAVNESTVPVCDLLFQGGMLEEIYGEDDIGDLTFGDLANPLYNRCY